jgi:hypothetical protein
MKKFSIPLDRVLGWRHTQTRLEEAKLDQLRAQLTALDRRHTELGQSLTEAAKSVVRSPSVTALEIGALEHYRAATARQTAQLSRDRLQLEQAIASQMQTVTDRRRDARLLERLRERKHAEWRTAQVFEGEQLAAESHLARIVRQNSTLVR